MEKRLYERHPGSVLIGGQTPVGDTSKYILNLVKKEITVELCFIGGNAGQQAYKVCERVTSDLSEQGIAASFVPERVRTETIRRDIVKQPVLVDGEPVHDIKDMFLWKLKT